MPRALELQFALSTPYPVGNHCPGCCRLPRGSLPGQSPGILPGSHAGANITQRISHLSSLSGTDATTHAYPRYGCNRYAGGPTESGCTPAAHLDARPNSCYAGNA